MVAEIEIRKLRHGEEAIYRAFRIHALSRFAVNFTSTAAEAEALPIAAYADRIGRPDDPRHFIIGAFDGDRLIGTACLSGEPRHSERHKVYLFGMAVHADFTGRGIGGGLVRHLIATARMIPGLKQINLSMTTGNEPAERLYLG